MTRHFGCLLRVATLLAVPALLLSGCATTGGPQSPDETELGMKTEALLNLPRYVDWPAGTFIVAKTPIILGIYGHSPMHKALLESAQGKVINGRTVLVRRYHWPQTPNCQVLFIAQSERYRVPWIIKKIEYSTTLTVSEFDDFLPAGGVVRMSMKEGKVRFHVNTTTAREAGLKFSSQFLSVADQVVGEP